MEKRSLCTGLGPELIAPSVVRPPQLLPVLESCREAGKAAEGILGMRKVSLEETFREGVWSRVVAALGPQSIAVRPETGKGTRRMWGVGNRRGGEAPRSGSGTASPIPAEWDEAAGLFVGYGAADGEDAARGRAGTASPGAGQPFLPASARGARRSSPRRASDADAVERQNWCPPAFCRDV